MKRAVSGPADNSCLFLIKEQAQKIKTENRKDENQGSFEAPRRQEFKNCIHQAPSFLLTWRLIPSQHFAFPQTNRKRPASL